MPLMHSMKLCGMVLIKDRCVNEVVRRTMSPNIYSFCTSSLCHACSVSSCLE